MGPQHWKVIRFPNPKYLIKLISWMKRVKTAATQPGNKCRSEIQQLLKDGLNSASDQRGLPAKPAVSERLFRMLAAQQGSILNASQLGQSLGITYHTVQSYLGYLEGAFLVRLLPPFHANIRKRLVKAPKAYWRDSGLVHALLNLGARR